MLPQVGDDGVDQRRLAGPGRPREADDEGVAEVRLQRLQQRRGGSRKPLKLGDHAGDGAPLAGPHSLDGVRNIGRRNAGNRRNGVCDRLGHKR